MTHLRSFGSRSLVLLLLLVGVGPCAVGQVRVLFDAAHRENAGNADWVIDADSWDLDQEHYPCGQWENESRAQRHPTPAPASILPDDPETTWTGALSAFGIDLVKLGYDVESLPPGGVLSYQDATNPQDLAGYDVLVLPEPNRPLDAEEITAVRAFVQDGGGLLLIADHQTSDRDCDGFDAPHIGNDLMGVVISGGAITDAGLFGIVFNVEEISGLSDADYWFDDGVDDNVSGDPDDPLIHGPHGDGSGGLGLFGATSMTLDRQANSTARGHVWKTDTPEQGDRRVTAASAWYGAGRIVCIGDSSPADDGTGDLGDNLYDGWDKASGGVNNREIHLNAVAFLADAAPDTVPPAAVDDLRARPLDADRVRLEWTAPGDDGTSGRAYRYDIRRAATPIRTAADFAAAVPLDDEPAPADAGAAEAWDVTGLDPETSYWFALVTEDDFLNRSPLSNTSGATTGRAGSGGPVADHLLLSEVQTRGAASHDDEFIEIYNPTDSPVDLSSWSVQYKSAGGTTYLRFDLPATASISADGYYLVARPEYTGSVPADAVQSVFLMSAGGGHVFLVDRQQTLAGCSGGSIIDKLGWGSADCPETAAAPAHGAGASIERRPGAANAACGNGQDSDDNSADFALREPSEPQNTGDTEAPCGPAGPGSVGPSLFVGLEQVDALEWAAAVAADTYKMRRSSRADFMQTHPVPDDTWLLLQVADTRADDPERPDPGTAYFYFVNAVDLEGNESQD